MRRQVRDGLHPPPRTPVLNEISCYSPNTRDFARAVKANYPCYQNESIFSFTLTLPPEAKANVDVYSEFKQNQIYFSGRTREPCASGDIDAADTRILTGVSVTSIFLSCFMLFARLALPLKYFATISAWSVSA